MYQAVFNTFRSITSYATRGSEIVLDYSIPRELGDPCDLPLYEKIDRMVKRRGEPHMSSFDPWTFAQNVCELGFELIEHLPPKEQEMRYFESRKDGLRPISILYFAHFRLRG